MLKLPHRRPSGIARTRPTLVASLLVALLLTPMGAGKAQAAGTLDQDVAPFTALAYSYVFDMGQTFTAGITGELDTVALHGGGGTWNVAIRNVSGGAPTGPNLATGSAPANGGWSQIALTPAIDVTAGTMYAIIVGGSTPFWNAAAGDYPGGTGFFGSMPFVLDFAFQTYVTPPPPPPPAPAPPEPPILDLIVTNSVGTVEAGPFSGSVTTAGGTTVWRRVSVTNGSNVNLGGITVSDTAGDLPASCPELPSWLAIGESWTCTFSGTAAAGTTTYHTSATGSDISGNRASGGAPATITGTVPAGTPAARTFGTKIGLASDPGAYTAGTKVAGVGRYVTWRANLGATAAGKSVGVYVSAKGSDGSWGPWTRLTGRTADASGNVLYSRREAVSAWLSVRFSVDGLSFSKATQARWQ